MLTLIRLSASDQDRVSCQLRLQNLCVSYFLILSVMTLSNVAHRHKNESSVTIYAANRLQQLTTNRGRVTGSPAEHEMCRKTLDLCMACLNCQTHIV